MGYMRAIGGILGAVLVLTACASDTTWDDTAPQPDTALDAVSGDAPPWPERDADAADTPTGSVSDVPDGTADGTPHDVPPDADTAPPHEPRLAVIAVEPAEGTTDGGTRVVVEGLGMAENALVFFGAEPALDLFIVDGAFLTCATPPGPPGVVDVTVGGAPFPRRALRCAPRSPTATRSASAASAPTRDRRTARRQSRSKVAVLHPMPCSPSAGGSPSRPASSTAAPSSP